MFHDNICFIVALYAMSHVTCSMTCIVILCANVLGASIFPDGRLHFGHQFSFCFIDSYCITGPIIYVFELHQCLQFMHCLFTCHKSIYVHC